MSNASRVLPCIVASSVLVLGAPCEAAERHSSQEQTGKATWYGGAFHGRLTASGTRFDQNAMTAAHPTLPLGSRIRVTRRDTGESVTVTITDRQPPAGPSIIDLSRGAAARIGLVQRGVGWVTLRPEAAGEPVELAEAPNDAPSVNPRRRGPPRRPPARP